MSDLVYILAFISLIPLVRMLHSLIVEKRKEDLDARLFEIWLKQKSITEKSNKEKKEADSPSGMYEILAKKISENAYGNSSEADLDARLFEIWFNKKLLKTKNSNKKSKVEIRFPDGAQFELKNSNELDKVIYLLQEGME